MKWLADDTRQDPCSKEEDAGRSGLLAGGKTSFSQMEAEDGCSAP